VKDATSIAKLTNHNRPKKELFEKAGAHVSKPDSDVYKKYKKRAKRTVYPDEEVQNAKKRFVFVILIFNLFFLNLITFQFNRLRN